MHQDFLSELLQFGIRFSQLSGDLLGIAKPDMLTPVQFEVLQVIGHQSNVSLSSLCVCTKLSLPNGSREVRKLTELGLVSKTSSANDKRQTFLALTELGQTVLGGAYQKLSAEAWGRYGHYSTVELDDLAQCLRKLTSKL